jgi:hypothetical protein
MRMVTAPARLGLRYEALAVRVESDEPAHLAWLREFLTPPFEVFEAPRPAWTVQFVTDAAGYADALGRGPDPGGGDVPCFWLDSGVVRLPLWGPRERGWTVLDRECRAFLVAIAPGTIQILSSGESPTARNALMRVVRELAMAEARRQGGLVLHAAGVTVGERVVLIAGPKGAGKTTLLVHLLRAPGTQFVANDRAVVWTDGRVPQARGLPTIVKLLRESAEWFPCLRDRLDRSPYHHRLTVAEAHRCEPRPRVADVKAFWSLSPAQFSSLVETTRAAGGPLEAVVFPRLVGGAGPIGWRRLPWAEAATAMAEAQLGSLRSVPPDESVPAWMRDAECPDVAVPTRAPGADEDRWYRLAERVPAFEVELGPDAYADTSSARHLLEAVAG